MRLGGATCGLRVRRGRFDFDFGSELIREHRGGTHFPRRPSTKLSTIIHQDILRQSDNEICKVLHHLEHSYRRASSLCEGVQQRSKLKKSLLGYAYKGDSTNARRRSLGGIQISNVDHLVHTNIVSYSDSKIKIFLEIASPRVL